MENKKAESQLFTFLLEYGWAIVVVFILIGMLSYFGVFNLGNRDKVYVNQDFCDKFCENKNSSCYQFKSYGQRIICKETKKETIFNTTFEIINFEEYELGFID